MQHLSSEQRASLETRLNQDKARLEKRLEDNQHYGLSTSMRDSVGELSTNDNHPADLGSEMFERGKDIALNENAEKRLDDVNVALDYIKQGKYGRCIVCDAPISYERLEAVPATVYCVDHVRDKQTSHRRPREEKVLYPPLGRTNLDERDDQNQFDGEDAWQIVEGWGTSNSRAMSEDPHVDNYDDMYTESDEQDGFVQPIESFLATDLYGNNVSVVRNKTYRKYMQSKEGEALLEPDYEEEDEDR